MFKQFYFSLIHFYSFLKHWGLHLGTKMLDQMTLCVVTSRNQLITTSALRLTLKSRFVEWAHIFSTVFRWKKISTAFTSLKQPLSRDCVVQLFIFCFLLLFKFRFQSVFLLLFPISLYGTALIEG